MNPPEPQSWKLKRPVDALTQGLVVSGFASLPTGRALLLRFTQPGGKWLEALKGVAPISNAEPPLARPSPDRNAALAFTWTGLQAMGLSDNALASFSRPFREGMMQEDRLRRLGDRREGEWLKTVVKGGPKWSGNCPLQHSADTTSNNSAFDVPDPSDKEVRVRTKITVHAILLLYAEGDEAAGKWQATIEAELAPFGVSTVRSLPLVLDPNKLGISSEHFGFADGLSQPMPFDEAGAVTLKGKAAERDPVQGVPLGEFLIGYMNGHREPSPGPVVPHDDKGLPQKAGLQPHKQAEGFYDLGLNGSYLVVRELEQDVAAFWQSMKRNADRIKKQDPANSSHVTADWLAERVIGRNRDGHLLCTGNPCYRPAGPDQQPDNAFLFHRDDPYGIGCPPGSHVRRANPRDALAPFPTDSARSSALSAANNHRILRRGRKFGPKLEDFDRDDGERRGLLFMCLNTDIARQFEFVQQTWLLNSNFATLRDEVDPLVGAPGRMTVREEPLRRTLDVDTFVRMGGGEYFFLPSMPALAYLGLL